MLASAKWLHWEVEQIEKLKIICLLVILVVQSSVDFQSEALFIAEVFHR